MKFKLLLVLMLIGTGIINAQPYRNLIFSEVRMDAHHHSYVELCNMGDIACSTKPLKIEVALSMTNTTQRPVIPTVGRNL